MSPLSKGLVLLFGIPVVMGGIFFTYFSVTGEKRMRGICEQVTPGMTYTELATFAQNYNFGAPLNKTDFYYLREARSYGRHTCKVTLDNGIVQNATYYFSD